MFIVFVEYGIIMVFYDQILVSFILVLNINEIKSI